MDEIFFDSLHGVIKAITVYVIAHILVRLADKRLLSDLTAFDVLVTIILGSILSRAVNGSAPLIPTIFSGAAIIGMHWLYSAIVFHFPSFRSLLRGKHVTLVQNGKIDWSQMRKAHLSENDLLIQLRKRAGTDSINKVKEARMETSGSITFQMKS